MPGKAREDGAHAHRKEGRLRRQSDLSKTQAMPTDGLKGAPDGVNTQGEIGATGGSDAVDTYPNPHQASSDRKTGPRKSAFKGGQSIRAYHGPRQLGDDEVEPGGNVNAGAKD